MRKCVYVKNVSRTIITIPLIVIRFVSTVIFYCNTHYCLNFTKKFGQPHFLHLSPSPPSHVKKGGEIVSWKLFSVYYDRNYMGWRFCI